MPNITSYTAPNIDLNPAERGVSAWDAAARRIGAFYGDVAGSQRAQGTLAAQALKMRLWPWDMFALYDAPPKGRGGGGANFRVRNAGTNLGGPTETFAGFGESRNTGSPYQAIGQVSRGAAALGDLLSDGGYTAGSMTSGGGGRQELDQWGAPLSPYQQRENQIKRQRFREFNEALAFVKKVEDLVGPPADYSAANERNRLADIQRGKEQEAFDAYARKSLAVKDYWRQWNGEESVPYQTAEPGRYSEYGNPADIPPPIPAAPRTWGDYFSGAINTGPAPTWNDYEQGIGGGTQGVGPEGY